MATQSKLKAEAIERWSAPFGRALGEFIRTVSGMDRLPNSTSRSVSKSGFVTESISEAEAPEAYAEFRRLIAQHENGPSVEFDPAVPAKHYGSKLKLVFKKRGIKQAVIARKLGVAPSVISRVFKHPEKSKLQTIRKIANAAGISMAELV
jgi:ribosome-binding protein aMBF1 (putative translation factor)